MKQLSLQSVRGLYTKEYSFFYRILVLHFVQQKAKLLRLKFAAFYNLFKLEYRLLEGLTFFKSLSFKYHRNNFRNLADVF